jgi:hypothetical protein
VPRRLGPDVRQPGHTAPGENESVLRVMSGSEDVAMTTVDGSIEPARETNVSNFAFDHNALWRRAAALMEREALRRFQRRAPVFSLHRGTNGIRVRSGP